MCCRSSFTDPRIYFIRSLIFPPWLPRCEDFSFRPTDELFERTDLDINIQTVLLSHSPRLIILAETGCRWVAARGWVGHRHTATAANGVIFDDWKHNIMQRKKEGKDSGKEQALMAARAIFQQYDADSSGFLECEEVLKFFREMAESDGGAQSGADAEKWMRNLVHAGDENGDNKLSQAELVELIQRVFDFRSRQGK